MIAPGQTLSGVTGPAPSGTRKGSVLAAWLSTTDHKIIGHMYLITWLGFFLVAGLMGDGHAHPADRTG
jgi:cytochrome c oxidase subunit 1